MSRRALAVLLLAIAVAGLLAGIFLGPEPISWRVVVDALLGRGSSNLHRVVWGIRLPRVILALLVGGGLAMAGAVFQALLRNPLAEPYILGISGGAATGAVSVMALGLVSQTSWALPAASFAGALLAILLVFRVASAADARLDVGVLLLAGVVVGAFFVAILSLILALSDAETVRSAVIWTMGSLAGATWRTVLIVGTYTVPTTLALLGLARSLNLMAIGEETASYLGADVERVKKIAYGVASMVTAAGVAATGVIGFVGLIVPHGVRLVIGSDNRALLPISFIAGGAFLTLADLVARTALAPAELPIGVITALVGVPLFLVLLRRMVRRQIG